MKWLLSFVYILFSSELYGQISPKNEWVLNAELSEISGLAFAKGYYYAHNDGGNAPKIYQLDSTGKIIKTYYIKNAPNTDWEAICINTNGDLFIGDIGNNSNNRTALKVFVIADFINKTTDTLWADTLAFSYASQTTFPAENPNKHYDAESLVNINDSLFIFSKNRSNPFNGYTYMNYLPSTKGTHTIAPIDSFYVGTGPKELDWITDAYFHKNSLWLLSHNFVLRFDSFAQKRLTNPKKITFNSYTQKEGCAYVPPFLYVTDEKNSLVGGGNMYQFLVDASISTSHLTKENNWFELNNHILKLTQSSSGIFNIYDNAGKMLQSIKVNIANQTIDLSAYTDTILVLTLTDNKLLFSTKIYLKP